MDVIQSIMDQGIFFFARACAYIVKRVSPFVFVFLLSTTLSAQTASDSNAKAISNLKSSDLALKYQAIQTLGLTRNQKAAKALTQHLTNERDTTVRLTLLDAIANAGDASNVLDIAPLLTDPLPSVRQRTALTIGRLGGRSAETALRQAAAGEQDLAAKGALLRALSKCGSAQSIPELTSALNDAHPEIRANAVQALSQISSPEALNALQSHREKDPAVQEQIHEGIRQKLKGAR